MKNLFKGQTISLVACGLLLSSSMAFGADTIDSAFKNGKASGSIALYGEKHDNKNGNLDSGFGNGNATVAYETASFYGFTAKAEFKGNLYLGEVETADYDNAFANNSLMTEAYVKYANDAFFLSAGRQAIDLEWLGDYNESVVAGITAIPDTVVVLGYTDRQAESGIDTSADFTEITKKGAYVADVKYSGLKGVEFNPYAYSAPDVVDFYGLKTTFTADYFGVIAHYAASSVDNSLAGTFDTNGNLIDDGSIGHLELNTTIKDLTAAVGYIKTDKDAGVGLMDSYGDNISPFDTGNNTYAADAKTVYGSLGYTIADIELGALYGETKFGTDFKEKELNLTVGYPITESLATSVLYGDVNADEANGDSDDKYVLASVEYTF
ncbi:MAG: Opr family porin [Aliarcobacter sp.]|nr:Opr family porin [Aliarcobacter sp.]